MASDTHKEASSSVKATDEINKRLYVGGLFPEVTDADLIRQFEKFGKVSSVDIIRRKDDQLRPEKTFAFVNMTTTDQKLKKCMAVYNKSKWKGHDLQIQVAKESFLSRLAQERKETRTELISKEDPFLMQNSEVAKPSQERQWTVQGAVPGTEVAGEKNWVIGKYGRVLPVVYIRRKDKKKVMKVDPSKFSHNLKKVKEERSSDPPISQLTWSIQVEESEEKRKKRQGDFSSFLTRKRSASTFKTKDKKMKVTTGYKTEESLFSSADSEAKSTVVQSEQGKGEEGGILSKNLRPKETHQRVQNKANNQEVGNISAEVEESDDDSDLNSSKEFSHTNINNKSALDAQSDEDNDFEVVSLEERSQGMTGVVDGNMLLQIKKQALLEKSRSRNGSEGSVDTDELITANKSRLVQGQNMKDSPETSSDTAEFIASSRSKLQSSVTTRDVSKNGPTKDEETGSESSGDTDEMIEAARGKLQAAMMLSSQTTKSKGQEERSANPPTPPPVKSFKERSVEKVQSSESEEESALSYDTALETSAHTGTEGKVTKQPLRTGERKNNSDNDDEDIDDVEEDGDDVQDDDDDDGDDDDDESEEESPDSDSSGESLVHPLNLEQNGLDSRQLEGISQVDDDDKDGDDVQDDDDDSESEEESPDYNNSGESLVHHMNEEENELGSRQLAGISEVDDDNRDGDDDDDDDDDTDDDDEGPEDESDDSDSNVEPMNQEELGPDTGEHGDVDDDSVDDSDDEEDDDDDELEDGSPDSSNSDESLVELKNQEEKRSVTEGSSEASSDSEESSDEEVKTPLHTKPSKSPKGITQNEDHKLLEKRADDTNSLRRANSSSTFIKKEPAGGGSKLSNEQRLESLRQRQLQVQSKQALIKEALSSVDSKGSGTTGKHIVFDSESEDDGPGADAGVMEVKDHQLQSSTPVKREEKKSQMGLFDSDSEEESDGGSDMEKSDDDRFKIKPQFEGKTGEKLLELQAQIGHDDRFRMDHRFMEEEGDEDDDDKKQKPIATSTKETESDVDTDLEAEKQKSLEILRRVVGTKAAMATEKGKNIDKLKFKDPSAVRYDPTREDHKQFEVPEKERQENVEGKKPETSETASQEEMVPDTDKDRYFEVASDLKEAFSSGDGQTFSFFGPSTTETVEDMETDGASDGSTQTAPKKSLWQPKVFQYDSSDDEDDNEINQEDLDRIAVKEKEVKRTSTFFFAADDPRLKEGVAQFCRRDKLEDIRRAWEEVRPELLDECKKRHKNAVRQRRRNNQNKSRPVYKKT